jgi:hypothetical protein
MLTAQLLYHKPEDPKAFLLEILQVIKETGSKHLLTRGDVETMYHIFDVTKQGALSKQQAYRAAKTVLGPDHTFVKSRAADVADTNSMLTKGQFVDYVMDAMQSTAVGGAT